MSIYSAGSTHSFLGTAYWTPLRKEEITLKFAEWAGGNNERHLILNYKIILCIYCQYLQTVSLALSLQTLPQPSQLLTCTAQPSLQNTSNHKHLNDLKSPFASSYWVHLTTDCIVIGYFFKLVFPIFVRSANVK
jgi:hypothetical protein